jgi:DNA-binding NarL/FixJ family response regulator
MINIIIADDHAIVRKGLNLFINYEDDLRMVGEAQDGDELMTLIENTEADVLLLDLDMPKLNGLTVIPRLHRSRPNLEVIILSMHPEEIYGRTAYIKGASGYITKDKGPRHLIHAIRMVQEGEKVFSPDILNRKRKKRSIKLSHREVQVLKLLVKGYANKNIAKELDISDKTVSTYKLRLLNKIGGHSTVDLINFATYNPDLIGEGESEVEA